MNDFGFRGRSGDLSDLHAIVNGVVCIVGDSGIGKSDLLAALAHGWDTTDVVAPASVLSAIERSLQATLADAIGDCLANYTSAHDGLLTRVTQGFGSLLDRATSAGAKEATQLLIASAFAAVEAKLGADAAKSLRSGLTDVLFTSKEDLS